MTARTFPGSAGINCNIGSVDTSGAFTWVTLYNTTSDTTVQYILSFGSGSGFSAIRLNNAGAITYALNNTGYVTPTAVPYSASDGWCLVAITKAAGTATFRIHKYQFSTQTWTRQSSTTAYASPGATTSARHGHANSSSYFSGDIAASASYDYAMSDSQVTALIDSFNAWESATPDGMWVFDQTSTATLLTDKTGGGADQETTVGSTSVSSATPPIAYTSSGPAAFRVGSGAAATGTGSSASLTIPSAVQVGDLMLLVVSYKLFIGTGVINTPSGWTVLAPPQNGSSGNTFQGAMYSKVAEAGDPGSTLTVTGTNGPQQINIAMSAYSGHDGVRSYSFVTGSTTASTSVPLSAPATAPESGDMVGLVGATRSATSGGQPTYTAPSGAAIRAQSSNTSGSAQNTGAFIGDHNSSAGSRTVTASSAVWYVAGQVVVKGAPTTVALTRGTSESITLTDALTRGEIARNRATAEGLTLAASAGARVVLARGTGEVISLADAAAANGNRLAAIAEVLGLTDVPTRAVARARGTAEQVTLTAAVGRVVARARGAAEQVTLTGAAARGQAVSIGVPEQLVLSDAWGYTASRAVSGAAAVTLTDVVARRVEAARSVAEAVALADSVNIGRLVTVGVAEALTLAGTVARAVNRPRGVGEAVSLDVAARPAVAYGRGVSESLTLADAATAGRVILVAVSEVINLQAAATRAATAYGRATAEVLAIANSVTRQVMRSRGTSEALLLADAWALRRFALTGWAETLTLTATASRAATATSRSVSEAIALGHTFARQVARSRALAETLLLVDDWLAARQIIPVSVAEEISFGDNVRVRVARSRGFVQPLTLADSAVRRINRVRGTAEAITLADLFSIARGVMLSVSLGVTFDAAAARTIVRARAVVEQLTLAAQFDTGVTPTEQPPVAYPHFVTMTSSRAWITNTTTASGGVRRTV